MVDGLPDFAERRRKRLEERARREGVSIEDLKTPLPYGMEQPSPSPPPVQRPPSGSEKYAWNGDDYESSDTDDLKNKLDIIQVYIRLCGKMVPVVGNRTEGVEISCPNPQHPDKNPSAWINTQKQVYTCGGCEEGGDVFDIAAYAYGYPVPEYKSNPASFVEVRNRLAEEFGYRIKKVPGGELVYRDKDSTSNSNAPSESEHQGAPKGSGEAGASDTGHQPESSNENGSDSSEASVAHMWADEEDDIEVIDYPEIQWRGMVPEETFLSEYLKACSNDDSPEEYHFWHGLIALGNIAGRRVTLDDHRPVYGNLLVCLLGATGTGKSRSRGWLNTVLKEVAPYREDGTGTTGVKIVPVPSSGEYLISAFSYEGRDPGNPRVSLGYQPVNGIVDFDELSSLLSRANRQGSTLKPTIMGFADAQDEVKIGGLQRGEFIAREPFCTITASTQPKALRNLLDRTDTASGFLNRWVFAGGIPKEIEILGGSHSNTRINLASAIDQLKQVRGWSAMERSLTLEPDAYEAYATYFRAVLEPTKLKDETDLLKRIDLLSKKLMLLFAINERSNTVKKHHVEMMQQIIKYVISCFYVVSDRVGTTVMSEIMTEIQRHLHRHWDKTGRGATPRDLAKYMKRRNYSLEQIKKCLDILLGLDIIELHKPPGSHIGRPAARYKVVGE